MTSSSETLKKRVEAVLDMALTTISSLSESFVSGAPAVDEGGAVLAQTEHHAGDSPKVDNAKPIPMEVAA